MDRGPKHSVKTVIKLPKTLPTIANSNKHSYEPSLNQWCTYNTFLTISLADVLSIGASFCEVEGRLAENWRAWML